MKVTSREVFTSLLNPAFAAQLEERRSCKTDVAGSNTVGGSQIFCWKKFTGSSAGAIVIYMNNNTFTFKPGYINMPMEFPGTPEERENNRLTHNIHHGRCMDCDCRPGGRVFDWACGDEPPRVLVKQ